MLRLLFKEPSVWYAGLGCVRTDHIGVYPFNTCSHCTLKWSTVLLNCCCFMAAWAPRQLVIYSGWINEHLG